MGRNNDDFFAGQGNDPEEQYAEADANQAAFVHHHENFHKHLDAAHALHAIVHLTGDEDAKAKVNHHLTQSSKHAVQCAKLNDGDPIIEADESSEDFGSCLHCGRSLLR